MPKIPAWNNYSRSYDSEINFSISAFYDEGFTWKLGDEMNGYKAEGKARTMKIAVLDLVQAGA